MFRKVFPKLSVSEISDLAEHSRRISAALAGCQDVVFPAVMGSDSHSITYQAVDCSQPLLTRLQAGGCCEDDMKKAGRILRQIHAASLLHSDYVPHNLFYQSEKLVLIDPHPPERLPFKQAYLYGPPHREVAGFIVCLLTDAGLKQALRHFPVYLKLISGFLNGYGPIHISIADFMSVGRDTYHLRRQAGYSVIHAFVHVVLSCFLSVLAVRLG